MSETLTTPKYRRRDIVSHARSLVGVKWQHGGRNRHGLDCVGLLAVVAREIGYPYSDQRAYDEFPDGDRLLGFLRQNLDPARCLAPGVVVAMRMWKRRTPHHVGIVSIMATGSLGLIHTHSGVGRVVEHHLDPKWASRVTHLFDVRGVDEWRP